MHCTRAVLPHMVANTEGRVITIISDAGRVGEALMAPYAAAKAGAAGFTRALAREVGKRRGDGQLRVARHRRHHRAGRSAHKDLLKSAERLQRQLKR